MNKKSIWISLIVFVLVFVGLFGLNYHRRSVALKMVKAQGANKGNSNASLVIKKKKKSQRPQPATNSSSNSKKDQYLPDEWMLMGYMAYAHDNYVESRHIKNTSDLVTDVGEDLSDGSLKAENTGNNAYRLTNKFGSVNVTVENDDVKVTGDGSTYTSKPELKSTFGSYTSQIKKMTQNITKGSSNSSDAQSSSQSSKTSKKSTDTNKLSDEELIVAAFLDDFSTPVGGKKTSTPQGQINLVKEILAKDNLPAKKIPTDEYLNGIHKNGNYYAIANNLSTSNYSEFNLNGNSDTITKKYGGGGVLQTKHLSKSKIVKTWTPYKNDIDQILAAIENNKKRSAQVSKELAE